MVSKRFSRIQKNIKEKVKPERIRETKKVKKNFARKKEKKRKQSKKTK